MRQERFINESQEIYAFNYPTNKKAGGFPAEQEKRMEKDIVCNAFFSDNERYADIINGIGCKGIPFVSGKDLQESDTKVTPGPVNGAGRKRKGKTVKYRDLKGGKVNMSKGLSEWLADERAEGHAEGKAEGRAEGKAEGRAEAIIDLLSGYGSASERLTGIIMKEKDLEILRGWLKTAAAVHSIEEFERKM